jgi:hypothetical protein
MTKKHKGGKKHHVKIWPFTLAGAIICWIFTIVLIVLMYQALLNFQIDLGDPGNPFEIFGIIFGTIGGMTGIIGVYAEWTSILFWVAIAFTVVTIIFAVLERKRRH